MLSCFEDIAVYKNFSGDTRTPSPSVTHVGLKPDTSVKGSA